MFAAGVRYNANVAHNNHNMQCFNSTSISDCDVVSNNSAWFCCSDYGESGFCISQSWHNTCSITDFCTNFGEYAYRLLLCTQIYINEFQSTTIPLCVFVYVYEQNGKCQNFLLSFALSTSKIKSNQSSREYTQCYQYRGLYQWFWPLFYP